MLLDIWGGVFVRHAGGLARAAEIDTNSKIFWLDYFCVDLGGACHFLGVSNRNTTSNGKFVV